MFGKNKKKLEREKFRNSVFERDGYVCRKCGAAELTIDAHHIIDRHDLGYINSVENGITLCANCHLLAEEFHRKGVAAPGYAPDDLKQLIEVKYGRHKV
jgi:5-methylcytosine-specific restriction endonuclease McrA